MLTWLPQLLPTVKESLPSIINLQPPANEAETLLLRSIEWTTYMESTYEVALEQSTVILRYFLGRLENLHSRYIPDTSFILQVQVVFKLLNPSLLFSPLN